MNYKEQIWEHHHYRFGLAGEGQADIIQAYLDRKRGRVLNIGCGPSGDQIRNLAAHTNVLIAADKSPGIGNMERSPAVVRANICFMAADARSLCLADESIDHIVALGLFACVSPSDTSRVLSEFYRVCRVRGHLMLTNSVAHPKEKYQESCRQAGFHLLKDHEGYCPAASGNVKQRYLLVLVKKAGHRSRMLSRHTK